MRGDASFMANEQQLVRGFFYLLSCCRLGVAPNAREATERGGGISILNLTQLTKNF
jgi:hypothetical protein